MGRVTESKLRKSSNRNQGRLQEDRSERRETNSKKKSESEENQGTAKQPKKENNSSKRIQMMEKEAA